MLSAKEKIKVVLVPQRTSVDSTSSMGDTCEFIIKRIVGNLYVVPRGHQRFTAGDRLSAPDADRLQDNFRTYSVTVEK
jgi:hypothetical protein